MRDKDGMYRLNDVPLGKISLFVKKGEGVHPQNGNLYTNQVRTVHLTEPGQVYSLMVMGTKDMKPTAFRVANEKKAQGKGNKRPDWFESYRLAQWWAERMLRTSRPLEEKMAFFWHGHFAVSNEKIADYRKMKLHIDTLRLHAAGNFRDLLTAVSKDPAMLVWLDANNNTKDGPNENFAREIMELFALGLDNYTEDDIREAARAFTGWSWEGLRFVFRPELHDNTIKTILGKRGYFGGDDVINILLDDSQCAALPGPQAPQILRSRGDVANPPGPAGAGAAQQQVRAEAAFENDVSFQGLLQPRVNGAIDQEPGGVRRFHL